MLSSVQPTATTDGGGVGWWAWMVALFGSSQPLTTKRPPRSASTAAAPASDLAAVRGPCSGCLCVCEGCWLPCPQFLALTLVVSVVAMMMMMLMMMLMMMVVVMVMMMMI
jgi:hypothetical protein